MSTYTAESPELLPLLSRGKHRNPRKGACFMELASYLAGEKWSDHPSCVHPLLAALARHVNDRTSDAGRPQLAPLIPSVIGLVGDDPHLDVRIALRCAIDALPVAAEQCQRVMAVSVLTCEEVLTHLDDRTPGTLEPRSREALAAVPAAERWARQFLDRIGDRMPVSVREFRRHAAPNTVVCAVEGIATACVPDPDQLLRRLLTTAIDDCNGVLDRRTPAGLVETRWEDACRLPGVATTRR